MPRSEVLPVHMLDTETWSRECNSAITTVNEFNSNGRLNDLLHTAAVIRWKLFIEKAEEDEFKKLLQHSKFELIISKPVKSSFAKAADENSWFPTIKIKNEKNAGQYFLFSGPIFVSITQWPYGAGPHEHDWHRCRYSSTESPLLYDIWKQKVVMILL